MPFLLYLNPSFSANAMHTILFILQLEKRKEQREREKVRTCSASFVSKYKVKQVWMAARVLHTRAVFLHCSQWKRSMPVSLSRPNRSQVSALI